MLVYYPPSLPGTTLNDIPKSVTIIAPSAFYGVTSLISVTFETGSQLKSIGESAFSNASSLTSINIPTSVTEIGENAFQYSGLRSILYNEDNTMLVYYPPSLSGTTLNYIPASVTSIAPTAFNGVASLASITIPASVETIGEGAFQGATNLRSVVFEADSHLTSIGPNAFQGASALTSITIPASVTEIAIRAFIYSALKTVYIPRTNKLGLTEGSRSFYGVTVNVIYTE
jgi:hypothetical protein